MSLSTTPARDRTDAPAAPSPTVPAAVSTRLVRRTGIAVAAGSFSWAAAVAALDTTPPAGTWQAAAVNVAAFAFQLGLLSWSVRSCAPEPSAPGSSPGACCTSGTAS